MVMVSRLLIGLAVAWLAANSAAARADDTQLWGSLIAQGPIAPGAGAKPMVWLELQPRFDENISRRGELIVRPGFGVRLAPDLLVLAGYHYQNSARDGAASVTEHRMWQQLSLPLIRDPERIILLTRLRLEQRIVNGSQDLGWRARAMLRLQLPLGGRGTAGPLFWSEALVGLNDTDWGQRSRVQQVRAFGGALVPLDRRLNFEAGYMAQIQRGPGADRVNHVANLTLNYRLGD
ncbi:MAG: DUF2490 domain-containing protein [Alphaproteobacteria bacterium]|nr:MAG: DUF2490 domain-containing protein [Alphaproteobacteria bacterium]